MSASATDPRFAGLNQSTLRFDEPNEPLNLAWFTQLALQLASDHRRLRIGLILHRSSGPVRVVVDGTSARAEALNRRFVNDDADAVVITDEETLSGIAEGSLGPLGALESNRLSFTGNYRALLEALATFSCSNQPIHAPCEGAV